jgi:hypothetical protein
VTGGTTTQFFVLEHNETNKSNAQVPKYSGGNILSLGLGAPELGVSKIIIDWMVRVLTRNRKVES